MNKILLLVLLASTSVHAKTYGRSFTVEGDFTSYRKSTALKYAKIDARNNLKDECDDHGYYSGDNFVWGYQKCSRYGGPEYICEINVTGSCYDLGD